MRFRKVPVFLSLFLTVLSLASPGWSASDTPAEIRRLVNEAPPLASFPGAAGMIWKQHVEYRMLADGSMEKTTRWFILSGKDLPEAWRTWNPTVRPEGKIEVLESGIFDPVTGRIVTPLIPRAIEGQGFRTMEIRSPELAEDQLLCVAFRQVIPTRYNVDDFLWAAFDIPCWEQTVMVEVPADSNFAWEGREVPQPSMEEKNGVRRYTWTVVNREAARKPSVAASQRPYLAFSLRRGIKPALDDLASITRGTDCEAPRALKRHLSGDPTFKKVRRFLKAVDDPARRDEELPGAFVRPAGTLVGTQAWTDWERTLLAGKWLADAGVSVEVYWLPRVRQKKEGPASLMAWSRPVLEVKPRGSDAFYWTAGQKDSVGSDAFSLFGRTLYRVRNGEVQSRRVPSGQVREHRLILTWDLDLNAAGMMEGKLRVDVRGGWTGLLGDPSRGVAALDRVVHMPDLPHFSAEKPDASSGDDSVRFVIPVRFNAGIPSGAGALLLRFPSARFPALDVAGVSGGDGLNLQFPFIIDQRYNIHLPDGYRVVAMPSLAGAESGAVRFTEELRERAKKGRLEGSFRLIVTETGLDAAQARAFSGISDRVGQWGALTIPLKK